MRWKIKMYFQKSECNTNFKVVGYYIIISYISDIGDTQLIKNFFSNLQFNKFILSNCNFP